MPVRIRRCGFTLLLAAFQAAAQTPELSRTVQEFVRVEDKTVVLAHVRIIDGTGAAAVEDRNIILENGKIAAIEPGADVAAAQPAKQCCH